MSLKILEASRRIELLYTDLQSGRISKENKALLFQKRPKQIMNKTRKFQA